MNFSALSIRRPVPAIMLFALLTLTGLLAFKANRIQDFPDIELPIVTVTARLEGTAPAQLETEVARKIEDAVAKLQGVKNIYTKILDGVVTVTVEFVLERDLVEGMNDVRDAVARAKADLPADMREPSVTQSTTAGRAVLTFTAAAAPNGPGYRMDEQELSWFVDDAVSKRLMSVPGLGAVKRVGGVDREIRVELDDVRMAALKATAADVSRALRSVQREAPGGRGDVGNAEQSVRMIATVETAQELAAMDLPLPDGRHVRLDQIATVRDSVSEPRATAEQDGRKVIGFEIFRTRGASDVDVAAGARAEIANLQKEHPNVLLTEVIDNAAPVQENFAGSMEMLYEGAVLAVLVVWWFLRNWRATVVAATALPLSVMPAFLGQFWFGYTLNTVTLLSLALVVGVLVDDAIVEIENIERHLRMGKTPIQAALDAADEIGMAVITTTLALVAVFLPTAFMGGITGRFFKQFGWTAVLAILASLAVARLLTPMMAAYILKPIRHVEARDGWIMQRYMRAMMWCLRHRRITVTASGLIFIGSLMLVPLLPTGFVPPADRNQTTISVELPPGSTLAETRAVAEQARRTAMDVPGITSVFSSIGGSAYGGLLGPGAAAEARRAVLTLTTVPRNKRHESMDDLERKLRANLGAIPGARFTVGPKDTGVKMKLVLRSEDPLALATAGRAAERDLRTLKGIGNVSSSAALVRPEIIVRPNFARAADLGVTASGIGDTLRIATAGDYDQALPKMNLPERQVPIRVRLPDAVRSDLDALGRLMVPGKNGPVMLATAADITMASGPAQIDRLNRSRNITLEVELSGRPLGEVDKEAHALPAIKNLPPVVKIAPLGDTQEMRSLMASFGIAMLIGVLCIYGVLVLLFNDFMQPVTILAALPLSMGGAFVALLITGRALSMPSLIGLIMLMGIVTKNSILLVDYAILARRQHMSRFDALVDACHKRCRPIIMTTIAMCAGMMPLALGLGVDQSFRSPMAIAVIGGLVTSTLLSLLVVPAVFTYIDDLELRFKRTLMRMRRHQTSLAGPAVEVSVPAALTDNSK